MRRRRRLKTKVRIFLYLFIVLAVAYYYHTKTTDRIDLSKLRHVRVPKGFSVVGIDVSHYNGDVNWAAIHKQGITFAYIKATEGESLIDKTYVDNYNKAKDNEIVTGMYHFFIFRKGDGIHQAKYFLSKLHYQKGDLPPAVDVEYSPFNFRSTDKGVIKERITELKQFDSIIYNRKKIHPLFYTNKACYEDLIRNHFPDNDLWLCNLSDIPDDTMYPNWVMWQYSHKGKLQGIKSKVDINVFYSGKADFDEWVELYRKEEATN